MHASRIFHRVFNDNDNDNRTSHFQCCVYQLQVLGSEESDDGSWVGSLYIKWKQIMTGTKYLMHIV